MSFIFSRIIQPKGKSAQKAKERLKDVLLLDRTNLSQKELDHLKDDLINTISKHVDIEAASLRIIMAHEGRVHRLIAEVPVRITHPHRLG